MYGYRWPEPNRYIANRVHTIGFSSFYVRFKTVLEEENAILYISWLKESF